MNGLAGNPDFQALYREGGAIHTRILAKQSELDSTSGPVEPHKLGLLRGEIQAFRWLLSFVSEEAKREQETPPVKAVKTPLRRVL